MILTVYITLMSIALFLIILGYLVDIKVLSLVGCLGIFYLGLLLSDGHVNYKSGELTVNSPACSQCINTTEIFNESTNRTDTVTTYGANFTYTASSQVSDTYTSINETTSDIFGRYLSIVSVLAFILIIISNKNKGARDP